MFPGAQPPQESHHPCVACPVITSLKYWCQILFSPLTVSIASPCVIPDSGDFLQMVKYFWRAKSDEKCVEWCPDEIRVAMWQSEVYTDIKTSRDGSYFSVLSHHISDPALSQENTIVTTLVPAHSSHNHLLFYFSTTNALIIAERRRIIKDWQLCHSYQQKHSARQ